MSNLFHTFPFIKNHRLNKFANIPHKYLKQMSNLKENILIHFDSIRETFCASGLADSWLFRWLTQIFINENN